MEVVVNIGSSELGMPSKREFRLGGLVGGSKSNVEIAPGNCHYRPYGKGVDWNCLCSLQGTRHFAREK